MFDVEVLLSAVVVLLTVNVLGFILILSSIKLIEKKLYEIEINAYKYNWKTIFNKEKNDN